MSYRPDGIALFNTKHPTKGVGGLQVAKSHKRHALIIEDDALIGLLLGGVLEEIGYECEIEAGEIGAILAASRMRPDLMIADGRLSDGSGVRAVKTILQLGPIPHLFITGDPRYVYAVSPDAIVIQKPFREHELLTGIALALRRTDAALTIKLP